MASKSVFLVFISVPVGVAGGVSEGGGEGKNGGWRRWRKRTSVENVGQGVAITSDGFLLLSAKEGAGYTHG